MNPIQCNYCVIAPRGYEDVLILEKINEYLNQYRFKYKKIILYFENGNKYYVDCLYNQKKRIKQLNEYCIPVLSLIIEEYINDDIFKSTKDIIKYNDPELKNSHYLYESKDIFRINFTIAQSWSKQWIRSFCQLDTLANINFVQFQCSSVVPVELRHQFHFVYVFHSTYEQSYKIWTKTHLFKEDLFEYMTDNNYEIYVLQKL